MNMWQYFLVIYLDNFGMVHEFENLHVSAEAAAAEVAEFPECIEIIEVKERGKMLNFCYTKTA